MMPKWGSACQMLLWGSVLNFYLGMVGGNRERRSSGTARLSGLEITRQTDTQTDSQTDRQLCRKFSLNSLLPVQRTEEEM